MWVVCSMTLRATDIALRMFFKQPTEPTSWESLCDKNDVKYHINRVYLKAERISCLQRHTCIFTLYLSNLRWWLVCSKMFMYFLNINPNPPPPQWWHYGRKFFSKVETYVLTIASQIPALNLFTNCLTCTLESLSTGIWKVSVWTSENDPYKKL